MAKEHPILFSTDMVRATQDGRKTMTRRIIKLPNEQWWTGRGAFTNNPHGDETFIIYGNTGKNKIYCPYGQVGDRLWVRETWKYAGWTEEGEPFIGYKADGTMEYKAVDDEEWCEKLIDIWAALSDPKNYDIDGTASDRKWRPSIFMPRWASRITLEITGIHVERVQDISNGDIVREGSYTLGQGNKYFMELWDSINAKCGYSWASNPWVWVIQFKRVEA